MLALAAAVYSALLILTGVAKLRRPAETSRALAAFGLPSSPALGWALGALELTIGVTALARLSPWAHFAQGLLYLGFTGWVVLAMRKDVPLTSCGCLGRDDTPPYWGHLALDAGGALVGLVGASTGPIAAPELTVSLAGLTHITLIGIGVFLGWLILDAGARLYGARYP